MNCQSSGCCGITARSEVILHSKAKDRRLSGFLNIRDEWLFPERRLRTVGSRLTSM